MDNILENVNTFVGLIFTLIVIILALSNYAALYLNKIRGFIQYQCGKSDKYVNRILNDLVPYDEAAKAILSAIGLFILFTFVLVLALIQDRSLFFKISFGLFSIATGLSLIYNIFFYFLYRKEKIHFIDKNNNEWKIINIYAVDKFVAKKVRQNITQNTLLQETRNAHNNNNTIQDSEIIDSKINGYVIINSQIKSSQLTNNELISNIIETENNLSNDNNIKIVSIEDIFNGNPEYKEVINN